MWSATAFITLTKWIHSIVETISKKPETFQPTLILVVGKSKLPSSTYVENRRLSLKRGSRCAVWFQTRTDLLSIQSRFRCQICRNRLRVRRVTKLNDANAISLPPLLVQCSLFSGVVPSIIG